MKCRRCRFASRLRPFSAIPSVSNPRNLGKAIVFFAFAASRRQCKIATSALDSWTPAIAAIRGTC